jgi:hypothetical protein
VNRVEGQSPAAKLSAATLLDERRRHMERIAFALNPMLRSTISA